MGALTLLEEAEVTWWPSRVAPLGAVIRRSELDPRSHIRTTYGDTRSQLKTSQMGPFQENPPQRMEVPQAFSRRSIPTREARNSLKVPSNSQKTGSGGQEPFSPPVKQAVTSFQRGNQTSFTDSLVVPFPWTRASGLLRAWTQLCKQPVRVKVPWMAVLRRLSRR